MKEIEQKEAKFLKFVEKQLETNEMIQQEIAEMVRRFELIQQTIQGMVQQFKSVQQNIAAMVQEQINNTQSLINDMCAGSDEASSKLCDVGPFSRDDSPASPTQTPPNAIPQIPLEPTSDTAVTEKTSENREEHSGSVLVDPSSDAMAPPSLDNRKDQGDRSRADSFSDAMSPQISEKPEEQLDHEDFSSFVDTSSPRGTLSRMDSITTIAQMKSMAEEVHQMNLTAAAADSPASPPPSHSCESLSSCLKSSPIAFGTQPFASVDYDETAKEDTIKICFSLKGENNFFQSTPKQINGYRFSLFVQCNKSPTKLLLGLFIKCRGPADGVGVGVPATVRIHPPVFVVHNCKGKDDVKMQAKSSMKFEPPYESSSGGGVWIELDGKQELINKGLITENELNIQVSASLEFHNPGSVTSLDI